MNKQTLNAIDEIDRVNQAFSGFGNKLGRYIINFDSSNNIIKELENIFERGQNINPLNYTFILKSYWMLNQNASELNSLYFREDTELYLRLLLVLFAGVLSSTVLAPLIVVSFPLFLALLLPITGLAGLAIVLKSDRFFAATDVYYEEAKSSAVLLSNEVLSLNLSKFPGPVENLAYRLQEMTEKDRTWKTDRDSYISLLKQMQVEVESLNMNIDVSDIHSNQTLYHELVVVACWKGFYIKCIPDQIRELMKQTGTLFIYYTPKATPNEHRIIQFCCKCYEDGVTFYTDLTCIKPDKLSAVWWLFAVIAQPPIQPSMGSPHAGQKFYLVSKMHNMAIQNMDDKLVMAHMIRSGCKDRQLWEVDNDGILRSKVKEYCLKATGKEGYMVTSECASYPVKRENKWQLDKNQIVNDNYPNVNLAIKDESRKCGAPVVVNTHTWPQLTHQVWDWVACD